MYNIGAIDGLIDFERSVGVRSKVYAGRPLISFIDEMDFFFSELMYFIHLISMLSSALMVV